MAYSLHKASVEVWQTLDDKQSLAYARACLGATMLGAHGDLAGARSLLEEGVTVSRQIGDMPLLGFALFYLGVTAYLQHDYESSRSSSEECRVLWQKVGNIQREAGATAILGSIAFDHKDYTTARSIYEESVRLLRSIKEEFTTPYITRYVLHNLGDILYMQGHYEHAGIYYEESLELHREAGNTSESARMLSSLGYVSLRQGHWQEAWTRFVESLSSCQEPRNEMATVACLIGLANMSEKQKQSHRAAQILGRAKSLWGTVNSFSTGLMTHIEVVVQAEYDETMASVRSALSEEAFEAAWAKGREMTLEQAIAFALEGNEGDEEKSA